MKINIFWFRRDLRLDDNTALYNALRKKKVLPIFIFDSLILNKLETLKEGHADHGMLLTLLKVQQLVGEINEDASSN